MTFQFYKYNGAGNDFVLLDNRNGVFDSLSPSTIQQLCHRRFGVGADGVICLQKHADFDFEMVYFNANGYEGSMCGNGGRCVVAFAHFLGAFEGNQCRFLACDGEHEARVLQPNKIALKMVDTALPEARTTTDFFIDTGSPHYVRFVESLENFDVETEGKAIRHNAEFAQKGTNVNFIEQLNEQKLRIETFERGVEAVTYACGTGAVAAALCAHFLAEKERKNPEKQQFDLQAKGGLLEVEFLKTTEKYTDIWLTGAAEQNFVGKWNLEK